MITFMLKIMIMTIEHTILATVILMMAQMVILKENCANGAFDKQKPGCKTTYRIPMMELNKKVKANGSNCGRINLEYAQAGFNLLVEKVQATLPTSMSATTMLSRRFVRAQNGNPKKCDLRTYIRTDQVLEMLAHLKTQTKKQMDLNVAETQTKQK